MLVFVIISDSMCTKCVLQTPSSGFCNLGVIRCHVDSLCDVSRRVRFFGVVQITRDLCFDEGGLILYYIRVNINRLREYCGALCGTHATSHK
jgi:hypothetical protein